MGTKQNPGKFDYYARAEPDEPMFVLLARDPLAPIVVRLWADLREHLAGNPSKMFEARECAFDMEKWRHRFITRDVTAQDAFKGSSDELA